MIEGYLKHELWDAVQHVEADLVDSAAEQQPCASATLEDANFVVEPETDPGSSRLLSRLIDRPWDRSYSSSWANQEPG